MFYLSRINLKLILKTRNTLEELGENVGII
jgi:hypothetical protein